jgi:two-component system LytT family sensor kinase
MKKAVDRKRIIFYVCVGIVYISLWAFSHISKYPGQVFELFMNNVWRGIYVTIINYLFFEYAIPFVLRKRRFFIYNFLLGVLMLWVYMMLWSYGLHAWRLMGIAFGIYARLIEYKSLDEELEAQTAFSMGSVFFFGILRHIFNYIKLKQAAQQLRIEKQEAELNYLKSQTNPHFLFNTLNNIYSLARDKSDLAPESILRLSKMLRFMLYETGGAFIAIEQELKIINDYIALEKLRYDESLQVNFNIADPVSGKRL